MIKRLSNNLQEKWTIAIIAAGGFAVLFSCIVLVFTVFKSPETATVIKNPEALQQVTSAIGANAVVANGDTITSTLGFSATYDTSTIDARAQTTDPASTANNVFGEEFSGDEMDEERAYSSFIFEVKDASADNENTISTLKPRLTVSTNIRDEYFPNREARDEYKGVSKIDILVSEMTKSRLANDKNVTASDPVEVKLGDVSYKKVTYTTSIPSLIGDEPYVTTEQLYMTVQNGRPYWASFSLIKSTTLEQLRFLEPIVASISFSNNDTSSDEGSTYAALGSDAIEIPKGSSYVPEPVSSDTIVSVVLKNQPAVVRIGTIRCINADLKLTDGSTGYSVQNACGAGVGSGSIVSKDGYIATNGHVVSLPAENALNEYAVKLLIDAYRTGNYSKFEQFIQYFVNIGVMTQSEAGSLVGLLKTRDEQAIDTLYKIGTYVPDALLSVTSSTSQYIAQLSNDPIRFVDADAVSDYKFAFNDTNTEATLVDLNYDENLDLSLGFGTKSDVAILKLKDANKEYPVVTLGSIDSVQAPDRLTALGFPAFVDGAVGTKQDKTVPSVTQGYIKQVGPAAVGTNYLLISTTVPIAGGNSGGPAFNDAGEQIGLNTYGTTPCADGQCFGEGFARDVADYKELVAKNGISLNTNSSVKQDWDEAIGLFAAANYKAARDKFEAVADEYPANYLAPIFAEIASSRIGGADDQSEASSNQAPLIIGAVILLVLGAGAIVTVIVVRKKRTPLAAAQQTYPSASPMAVTTPVQPVQTPQPQQYTPQPTPVAPQKPVQPTPQIAVTPQPAVTEAPVQPQPVPQTPQVESTSQPTPPTDTTQQPPTA